MTANDEERKIERGPKAPVFALEDAIKFAVQVYEGIRSGPASAEHVASALGYKNRNSGAASTKIGALGHYGLLKNSGKGQYQLTELALKIIKPQDDSEKSWAIQQAALSPVLFLEFYNKYQGEALPVLLANILCRQYGYAEQRAEDLTAILKENLDYAGLMRNGVVTERDTELGALSKSMVRGNQGEVDDTQIQDAILSKEKENLSISAYSVVGGASEIIVNMSNVRMAQLKLPNAPTREDIMEIINYLKYYISENGPLGKTDSVDRESTESEKLP